MSTDSRPYVPVSWRVDYTGLFEGDEVPASEPSESPGEASQLAEYARDWQERNDLTPDARVMVRVGTGPWTVWRGVRASLSAEQIGAAA